MRLSEFEAQTSTEYVSQRYLDGLASIGSIFRLDHEGESTRLRGGGGFLRAATRVQRRLEGFELRVHGALLSIAAPERDAKRLTHEPCKVHRPIQLAFDSGRGNFEHVTRGSVVVTIENR